MKKIAITLSALITLSSCVQLSTFQTAKTVGDGNGEILVAVGGGGVTDSFDGESLGFGTFELGGRLGVADKVDVGLKISHFVSYLVDVKFQFVGDEMSKFAMATGPGIGFYGFGFGGTIFQATLPLHMSVHPSDHFAFYMTPRYSTQFAIGDGGGALHYLGGSVGFEAGRNVLFGTDISYMSLLNDAISDDIFEDFGLGLFQVGFGVKFRIHGKRSNQ